MERLRRYAGDLALGLAVAATLAVQVVRIATSWGGTYWLPGCVAGAAVCVAAVLRRRWAAATVLGLAVAAGAVVTAAYGGLPREPSPAMALSLAVLAASAVRVRPARWATATVAGAAAVVAASWLTASGSTAVPAIDALLLAVAVVVGLLLRLREVRRRAAADAVRRDERLELAREMHDVVAHHVTGIVVAAQAARITARRDPGGVDGSLAEIESAGAEALTAIRRVVGLLRDVEDAPPARTADVRELVDRFPGPPVRLLLPDDEPDAATAGTVYRIVQEALTNVARHAPGATAVSVAVTRDRRGVTVEVSDDAPAARTRRHAGGYGLVGMRERVEALGGTLRAGPLPGAGWAVVATVPAPGPA
ncbi:MAG TPA: histidine kinase [Actinocatenispora sp.]